MAKHFIVYNQQTGAVLRSGVCQDNDFLLQAQDGEGVIEATAEAITVVEVNLQPVKTALCARVNADAEEVRSQFITMGSGQAMTYLMKHQEAVAFAADPNASVPMLSAEAQALGLTVAQVAEMVSAAFALWTVIGSAIEAARRQANVEIMAADNLLAMNSAATINWPAIIAATQN